MTVPQCARLRLCPAPDPIRQYIRPPPIRRRAPVPCAARGRRHCVRRQGRSSVWSRRTGRQAPRGLAGHLRFLPDHGDSHRCPCRSYAPPAPGRGPVHRGPALPHMGGSLSHLPQRRPGAGRQARHQRCRVPPSGGRRSKAPPGKSARGEATTPGHLPRWVGVGGGWKDVWAPWLCLRQLALTVVRSTG